MKLRIESDGTAPGTQVLDEAGNSFACSRLTWTVSANEMAKLALEVHGVPIRADATMVDVELTDASYEAGRRAAMNEVLRAVASDIADDAAREVIALRAERDAAVSVIRDLCREFALLNDWPDDLHLADILSNYVIKPLQGDGAWLRRR